MKPSLKNLLKDTDTVRQRVIGCLDPETSLADELFGPSARADMVDATARAIKDLHRKAVQLWSLEHGTRAEVAWVIKDRAEMMNNVVTLQNVVRRDFLEALDIITGCVGKLLGDNVQA